VRFLREAPLLQCLQRLVSEALQADLSSASLSPALPAAAPTRSPDEESPRECRQDAGEAEAEATEAGDRATEESAARTLPLRSSRPMAAYAWQGASRFSAARPALSSVATAPTSSRVPVVSRVRLAPLATPAPQSQIRVDASARTLDSFLVRSDSPSGSSRSEAPLSPRVTKRKHATNSDARPMLASVEALWARVEAAVDADLREALRSAAYVGRLDARRHLLQLGTSLVAMDLTALAAELAYQTVLREFGRLSRLRFREPLDVRSLLLRHEQLAEDPARLQEALSVLERWSEMLREYVAVDLQPAAAVPSALHLHGLPQLLGPDLPPAPTRIPTLLRDLALEVDYTDGEERCFHGLATVLSRAYALAPDHPQFLAERLLDLLRARLLPLAQYRHDGTLTFLTSTESLYRQVFLFFFFCLLLLFSHSVGGKRYLPVLDFGSSPPTTHICSLFERC
jgi:hypothetical protein